MATTINPSDQTITQYNIQTGGASNLLNNVAPSATSGVPIISQGAASQPVFGTTVVAGGGTGHVTLTNHGVLVGALTSAITQLAAGSAGQVLQSGGASADPVYSTATFPATATATGTLLRADGTNWVATTSTYPNTNAVSTLLYASASNVMSALTTANNGMLVTSSTGVPSILAGPGTTGNILQSNAAAAPSFSTATYPNTTTSQQILYSTATNVVGQLTTANSALAATNSSGTLAMRLFSIVIQTFTSTGTYTPTAGMLYCQAEVVGGGGGSGGCATCSAIQYAASGGGGGGEYARGIFSAATIGASQTVTIGAAGAAGTAGANTGGTGGTTSIGSTLISSIGGSGGAGTSAVSTANYVGSLGGIGGTGGTGGQFRQQGSPGGQAGTAFAGALIPGFGGNSYFGGGALQINAVGVGNAGQNYGSGASGSNNFNASAQTGAAGAKGFVVITEYIIA